jgi:hypothetical protein
MSYYIYSEITILETFLEGECKMQYVRRNQKWLSKFICLLGIFVMFFIPADVAANVPEGTLANMPVKEITIFKDGHAFVLHEGKMPTDTDGNVVLDYLPRPIIGTFWAYSADTKAKLTGVVSGKHVVCPHYRGRTQSLREHYSWDSDSKLRRTRAH